MPQIKTILVPVDFSAHSRKALDYAVHLAKTFGAEIRLLHCYQINPGSLSPYGPVLPEEFTKELRSAAQSRLEEWRDLVSREGVVAHIELSAVFPSEAISRMAESLHADLIVIGTRGLTGLKHVLLGSVAERTVRTAPCPVLTVKDHDAPED
ncbi:MAG: universal stress protein [Acidobacteriota bacterium]|nr:universal stress protein [Acidobacteriota bacterium]